MLVVYRWAEGIFLSPSKLTFHLRKDLAHPRTNWHKFYHQSPLPFFWGIEAVPPCSLFPPRLTPPVKHLVFIGCILVVTGEIFVHQKTYARWSQPAVALTRKYDMRNIHFRNIWLSRRVRQNYQHGLPYVWVAPSRMQKCATWYCWALHLTVPP